MKKKISLFIIFYLVSNAIFSQQSISILKWGKITEEEKELTFVEFEPQAPAVNLYRNSHMYFNTNPGGRHLFLFYEYYTRIKFFSNYQTNSYSVSIPYYDFGSELRGEVDIKIKAQAFIPDGNGNLNKTKIKGSSIEHKKTDKYGRLAIIYFNNIKPGTIIEYVITRPSFDFEDPRDWEFQDNLPTLNSTFEATIPETFQYLLKTQYIDSFDIQKEEAVNQSVNWYGRSFNYRGSSYNRMTSTQRIKTIYFNSTKYSFTLKNIPSYNEPVSNNIFRPLKPKMMVHLKYAERKATNISSFGSIYYDWEELTHHLVTSLQFKYDSYSWDKRKLLIYPSGFVLYKWPTWNEINRELLKSKSFGIPLKTNWEFKPFLDSIISPTDSDKEKMIKIYDFVRDYMQWNGVYSIFLNDNNNPDFQKIRRGINKTFNSDYKFIDQTLYKPFNEKTGTSSEINMLLIYLLKKANLDSDPVIISTVENGIIDTSLYIFSQLNHVICRVKIDNKTFLLDAIHKELPYYALPLNDLNGLGWLVRYKNPHWIPLQSNEKAAFKSQIDLYLDENNKLKGSLSNIYEGYEAMYYQLHYNNPLFHINFKTKERTKTAFNGTVKENAEIELDAWNNILSFTPFRINMSSVEKEYELSKMVKPYPYEYVYQVIIHHNGDLSIKQLPENVNYTCQGRKYSFFVYSEQNEKMVSVSYRLIQNFPFALVNEKEQITAFLNVIDEKLQEEIIVFIN